MTDQPPYKTGHDLDQGYVTIKALNNDSGRYEPLLAVASLTLDLRAAPSPVNTALLASKAVALLNGQKSLAVPAIEDGYLNYNRTPDGEIHIRHRGAEGCSAVVLKICPHKAGDSRRAAELLGTLDQLFMKNLVESASLPHHGGGPQARAGKQTPKP